ncbi:type II toxin-antitoxin system YafQ family toxin [Anaeromassilibacillus senegalensis]|uniref:type II toxin-antitoxin system YafQ family toxin n=1 Tax=Anaeromassilibacillus senegalensis TaxID=1673717 RepID=UPI000682A7F5|nr:type II toxin-antitoxin system YafQ family toxin [Anaeromassilibacillus senegalensis]
MKYEIESTGRFKKDLKTILKRGYNMELLQKIIDLLCMGESLPEKCKDHALSGNWANYRECHVAPDWLLIYKIEEDILILTLTRTGSHSDLF